MNDSPQKAEKKKRELALQREKRLEEQERIIREQQMGITQPEAHSRRSSESFAVVSNAFFWQITRLIRSSSDIVKWLFLSPKEKGLLRKGLGSLRTNGLRVTWQKAMQKIYFGDSLAHIAKQTLFSEEELAQQRKHRFSQKVKFSIVVPLYNTPERFLREMIESVQAQTYADWELCMADGSDAGHADVERICRGYAERDGRILYRKLEENRGISGNTNACLEMAAGEYVGLFDHDDVLHPAALYEVMSTIENTGADLVYTDEATFDSPHLDRIITMHFKPDFAPDTLRANNYICHFTVFKRTLLERVGLFDPVYDGSQDHDMVLRLMEKAQRVAHIPEILYYWRSHPQSVAQDIGIKGYAAAAGRKAVQASIERSGYHAVVESSRAFPAIYRLKYELKETPLISILIPTRNHKKELEKCLASIFTKTTYQNYEIILADNGSDDEAVISYYHELEKTHPTVSVFYLHMPFNASKLNNFAARHASGQYYILLHNDVEVITPNWIEEMLMYAQREDVGAVGCMLCYPDNTIQHAGVVMGMDADKAAGYIFRGCPRNSIGYMGRLCYAQNLSAVSAACMMVRASCYHEVGGFDEQLTVSYNDVDFCLKQKKAGRLIVWTPYAELYHDESKTGSKDQAAEKRDRFASEIRLFRSRWAKELEAGDPYYNPNLTLDRSDFFVKPDIQQYDAR